MPELHVGDWFMLTLLGLFVWGKLRSLNKSREHAYEEQRRRFALKRDEVERRIRETRDGML